MVTIFQSAPSPARCMQGNPGGPKPVAKPPGTVLSGNRKPASTAKTDGKGATTASAPAKAAPSPPSTGPLSIPPTAAGELQRWPPVEQVAQKRRATSLLMPRQSSCPTDPTSLTCWEIAQSRMRGGLRITSLLPLKTFKICHSNRLCQDGIGHGFDNHQFGGGEKPHSAGTYRGSCTSRWLSTQGSLMELFKSCWGRLQEVSVKSYQPKAALSLPPASWQLPPPPKVSIRFHLYL